MASTDLPETHFAQSGDVSIAYQVIGDGPVDLVIVPGIVSHLEAMHDLAGYSDFLRRLSRFSRVAIFDKRGQGLSDRVLGAPTLEERADDVRAVMEALGMTRVALCGNSEGATLAAYFAATYPERVSHLILVGGIPKFSRSDDYPHGYTATQHRKAAAAYGNGRLFAAGAAPLSQARDPATIATGARFERLSCSPGNFRALIEMNLQLDVRPILPEIRVPTLVLHRQPDLLAPVAGGRYFAEHIPGATYIEYPTGDHWITAGDYPAMCADIEEFVTGERPHAAASIDRILATVLFTDIADSTAQAAQMGDAAWREQLDEHDRIARRLIEQHRGRLIKTTGDGVLATFDGPGRAIRCALAMEPALARLHMSIRAGLHTGEVEDRGDDIGGIAVHAASRVMSKAGPGEVLVSRVVADLVAGSGIGFADRGEVELKGMPGIWRLLAASL
jgi:pimeloyl-ACP methyl ester carboxylesterase/class 3 adenylate cyclase